MKGEPLVLLYRFMGGAGVGGRGSGGSGSGGVRVKWVLS